MNQKQKKKGIKQMNQKQIRVTTHITVAKQTTKNKQLRDKYFLLPVNWARGETQESDIKNPHISVKQQTQKKTLNVQKTSAKKKKTKLKKKKKKKKKKKSEWRHNQE